MWDEIIYPLPNVNGEAAEYWECNTNFAWRRHEAMSPYTGIRVNTNCKRFAFCGGCQVRTRATQCCFELPNHSTMAGSSKRIGISRMVSHIRFWTWVIPHWAACSWRLDIIVARRKHENMRYVVSSHTLMAMWLLIHTGIQVNPC